MKSFIEVPEGAEIISKEKIKNTFEKIGWNKLIDAVGETFVEEAHKRVISPAKTIIPLFHNNDFRTMPAYMEKYTEYIGLKDIGACADNYKQGLPLAVGHYTLRNAETLEMLMHFDANISTAYRTAAASAVGVHELTDTNVRTLGIVGCGQQAYYHIPAIQAIRHIEEIYVTDLDESKADKLINHFDMGIKKMSKRDMFCDMDVMVTMTTAKEPHMFGVDIPNREFMIASIGADCKLKSEFSPGVLNVADHFCDSYEQVAHTGTFHKALKKRLISESDLKSLGDYMIGKKRLDDSRPVKMFFSTGVALEDLAMARLLYEEFATS